MSAVQPPAQSDRAASVAVNGVRRLAAVSPLDIGRAGLVVTLLAAPLPSGALMNLGLAIALAAAALHLWSSGLRGARLPAAVWLMVAFTGATAVSALMAIDPWCSFAGPGELFRAVIAREAIPLWCGFRGLLDTARSTVFFVLAVRLLDAERLRRTWLVAIVAVTCFVTLSGLIEYALGHRTGGLFLRDVAIGHSNQTASYLVMTLPVAAAVLMSRVVARGARLLASITLALGAFALVLTQSLTAWAAGIALTVVFALRVATRRVLLLGSVGVVIATAALVLMGPAFEKFTATWLAMSTGSRRTWWAGALRVISDHPWFGIGPRNFILIDRGTYDFQTTFHAHNLYLNIASEHGLVGLALLVAAIAAIASRLKATHGVIADGLDRACWWAAASAVLAFVLLGVATTPYHSRHAIALWAIVGCFYAQFHDRPPRVRAA